jgi:hypothetical protein
MQANSAMPEQSAARQPHGALFCDRAFVRMLGHLELPVASRCNSTCDAESAICTATSCLPRPLKSRGLARGWSDECKSAGGQ